VRGALFRYRVMAYVVGVGLLVLVLIGMPLQYGAGQPAVVTVLGPIHGFFYIVYLLAAIDLGRRAQCTLLEMVAMSAAGLLPFFAFIVERRMTQRLEQQLSP
jgi:integral membrane protein